LLDRPIADLKAAIQSLDWDAEPEIVLLRSHIVSALQRFALNQLSTKDLEEWANLIECREDIEFEREYEHDLSNAIFSLANPELQGSLASIASTLIERLSG
jgi:hypothetical protein